MPEQTACHRRTTRATGKLPISRKRSVRPRHGAGKVPALTDSKMKGDPLNSGCPRGLWDGLEADGEAESVGLFGDAAHDVGGFASGEVVGPEFVVVDVVHEHALSVNMV